MRAIQGAIFSLLRDTFHRPKCASIFLSEVANFLYLFTLQLSFRSKHDVIAALSTFSHPRENWLGVLDFVKLGTG